jgi:hypothetical protein
MLLEVIHHSGYGHGMARTPSTAVAPLPLCRQRSAYVIQISRTIELFLIAEQLRLLKALALWSLSSSDAVQAKIKESYKQNRHDDDLNQPLSVQPWGRDELKRRYWLIEGQDDTHFRLYRESNPALKTNTWWSVAGTIDEAKAIAESLEKERSQHSKRLSEKIKNAIPRFESGEEVGWLSSRTLTLVKLIPARNADVATTDWHEKPPFLDQNPDFHSMKVVLGVRS